MSTCTFNLSQFILITFSHFIKSFFFISFISLQSISFPGRQFPSFYWVFQISAQLFFCDQTQPYLSVFSMQNGFGVILILLIFAAVSLKGSRKGLFRCYFPFLKEKQGNIIVFWSLVDHIQLIIRNRCVHVVGLHNHLSCFSFDSCSVLMMFSRFLTTDLARSCKLNARGRVVEKLQIRKNTSRKNARKVSRLSNPAELVRVISSVIWEQYCRSVSGAYSSILVLAPLIKFNLKSK